jgi:hypothetical protein
MTARETSGPTELNVDPDYVRVVVARSRAALFEMPKDDGFEPEQEMEIDQGTELERDDAAQLSDEAADNAMREEAAAMIDALNVDEQAELVALTWIGRGDYEPGELEIAVAEAKERARGPASGLLFEMEIFPSHLENGLSAWESWRARQAD